LLLKGAGSAANMIRVGIDAVDVSRIKSLHQRYGERFLKRLYTPRESSYALAAHEDRCFERLAACFAAKEALIKAAGCPLAFTAIEVSHSLTGRPHITCALIEGKIEASLSHTRRLAIACVLLERATSSPRPAQ